MKKLFSLLLVAVLFVTVSCGGSPKKAAEAFESGKLKVGSTYEEVIGELGKAGNEVKRDKAILLSYVSLTGKYFYVLLDNDGSGKYLVKEYSDDQMKGVEYEIYVKK